MRRHVGALRRLASSPRGLSLLAPAAQLFINGRLVDSEATAFTDVIDAANGAVVARTPQATDAELASAFHSAATAFNTWRDVPVTARSRVMFRLAELIRAETENLAASITREQGKTLADARGDVFRGLEVVEAACGVGTHSMGQFLENVSTGMDTYAFRQPLGVCAGICPFNFPAMIPLWMFPLAVACGNTYVLKPSERTPGAALLLAQLAHEAGLPPGVLNIVHGTAKTVNALCDSPVVQAVSFVGGDAAGAHVAARAGAAGKRTQVNMGAKNHAVVMPDCHPRAAARAVAGAAFGAAGQRCMALSAVVTVGECAPFREELRKATRALRVGPGSYAGVDVGPVISRAAQDRIGAALRRATVEGARLTVDGAAAVAHLKESGGFFVGPTLLEDVTQTMECHTSELFGPVLGVLRAESLDEAVGVVNACRYGNGASIFTTSGAAARRFQHTVQAGQVGVNVPIPVALPFFSFTGWKNSFSGSLHFYGQQGVHFFTRTKTVTASWKAQDAEASGQAATSFPTSKDA